MGIKFHCPNGHKLNVKSFLAGKRGICPQCGKKFVIPGENQANPTPCDSIALEAKSATTDISSSLSKLSPIATTNSAVSTDHQTIASGMPSSDSENSATTMLRKLAAVLCYVLAAIGLLMLVKTELRKWVVMAGDAAPANTIIFWISLGWAAAFGFAGSKLWPTKKGKSDDPST